MRAICVLILASLLFPRFALTQDFSGEVITIRDGDSVVVLTPQNRRIEVRLADIDAPERGQPYANRSRQLVSELVFRKTVQAIYMDTDSYGRIVARLYAGDVDVSAEMIRRGAAWVYRQYVRDESLFALEEAARNARRGIWGLSESAVPPWEWRRNGSAPAQGPQQPPGEPFTCGTKTVCRQMSSCEEARFYLTQCGLERLDGDNDGIPCENICR